MRKIYVILLMLFLCIESYSQCLTATNGLYPAATFTPTCSGTSQSITTVAFASEYSNVSLTSGVTYIFTSSLSTDLITISDAGGTTALAFGFGSVTFTATSTAIHRFYTHKDAACTAESVSRTRAVTCTLPPCSAPTAQATSLLLTPASSSSITGSFTAASPAPTNYLVVRTTTNTAPTPVNGTTYTVGANAIGFIESVGTGTTFTSTGLIASTQYYYWVFSYNSTANSCSPAYLTTTPLSSSATTLAAQTFVTTALGGLWSSTATWVGGVVPGSADNITVANGAILTIDGAYTIGSITVGQGTSGVLQWNATSNALTVQNNITIASGGRLLAYTSAGVGQTINVGGNFTNNGYANLAVGTTSGTGTLLNFNGSTQGTSTSQTLGGTGTFEGNGTQGIIRALFFQTTGTCTISTTQNLITTSFAHTAGILNTNGRLIIDNTALVYGRPINTQVASIAVTTMGTAYTSAPVVFGASVNLWTAGGSATLNSRYFSGNNVYLATTAGTFDAATAPTHTSGSVTNGTVPLLWIGTLGTLGTPFQQTAVTSGTQYFYGNNLYVCTVAGTPSATAPPVHTSGSVVSGTATFLYAGIPAAATVNYDATAQNVRSLTITNAGSGYSAAPSIVFSTNGGSVTTAASATAVLFQSIAYGTNSLTQSSGSSIINGTISINSNQSATSFSGVGSIFTTSGGVGYSVAPAIGFTGPTAINLVTSPGSGYTAAPTITVTGGTLISGTALTSSNFTITVANGQVVSVYLNSGTTAAYSIPPTLSFSAGNATLTFPTAAWPTATANIGANGQITSFTVTNAGYGYVTAPTVGIGTTSGTTTGGTFITAATTPTARIALYNLTYGNFIPATSNTQNTITQIIPTNGKLNSITINSISGALINSNIELFSSSPLTLTSGVLSTGTNTSITCSNYAYAGQTGSTTSSVDGTIKLTSSGGSVTRTFPFEASFLVATGTGSLATGSNIQSLTATRLGTPSGSVNSGIGTIVGSRSYQLRTDVGVVYGTAPTVTLNYNANDALTTVTNNADLLIGQSTAITGAWTIRSLATGTGTLSATGSRTTATSGVGPFVSTGNDIFAWIKTVNCTGTPTTGVISASSSDACTGGAVTFTSSTFTSASGMTYRWQTSTTGGDPWDNTTTTTPSTFTLTFANSIWVRRVDTCTNSGQFAVSNAIQITNRAPNLCYCSPGSGTSLHSSTSNAINNVTISPTTLNNSNIGIGNTNGYIEFPASGSTTATLQQGSTYTLSTTLAASATIASVWFDWNANGTYETTEWTQITTSNTAAGDIITLSFTVPSNAAVGLTGMRIRTRSAGSSNAGGDPCTTFASGETEQYFVTIAAGVSCTGTPNAGVVTAPNNVCTNANFTLVNTGFTNGVIGINYRWQSATSASGPWINTTGTNPSSFTTSQIAATYYRLVDTCTNSGLSAASAAVLVSLNAATYATLPFSESFENTWINGCGTADIPNNSWRNNPITTDSSWRRDDDAPSVNTAGWTNPTLYLYSPTASNGSRSARFHAGNVTAGRRGVFDLYLNCSSSTSGTNQLTFDYINTTGSDSLVVSVSTNGGTSFTRLDSVGLRTVWSTKSVNFTSNSATTIIRFTAIADFGTTDIGLDNINVSSLNICTGAPTAGTISASSSVCANTSFTITATGYTTGQGGLVYRWQTAPASTGPWTNTTGTNPASFSTTQSAATFYRLVDTCTNSGLVGISNVVSVTMNAPTSCYCTPTSSSGCSLNDQIESFRIGTLRNLNSGCNGNTNGYINYASTQFTTTLARGTSYADTLTSGTGSGTHGAGVWIDFNQNGSFTDAGEFFLISNAISASATVYGTVTVPANALIGTTRMRVRYIYNTTLDSTSACSTNTYSETEDYTITIAFGLPVSMTSFLGEKRGVNNFLSWTTASEVNNAGFELQRSADGVNFAPLEFISSKAMNGNSNASLTYTFTDYKALTGTFYYRLKQVDKDGKSTYSTIVMIKGAKVNSLQLVSVYPNPVKDALTIKVSAPKTDQVQFVVSDIAGRIVYSQAITTIEGDNIVKLPVQQLASGTYTIKAICANGCETAQSKFIKQ